MTELAYAQTHFLSSTVRWAPHWYQSLDTYETSPIAMHDVGSPITPHFFASDIWPAGRKP